MNVPVAGAFWAAGAHKYGFSDGDDISMHYEEWAKPTAFFLAIAFFAGLLLLCLRGWRRFGLGMICGAVTMGVLDFVWTFVYLVSQGS